MFSSKSLSHFKIIIIITLILIIFSILMGCSDKQVSNEAAHILNNEKNTEITNDTSKDNNIINNDSKTGEDNVESEEDINITIGSTKYNLSTLLETEDIKELNKWEISILRNAYYAKYGYVFKTDKYIEYFEKLNWYKGKYDDVSNFMTETDNKNINLILNLEKRLSNKEDKVVINIDEFFNLKDCIIKNITDTKNKNYDEYDVQAKAEYDLNKDGKNDVINIQLKCCDDDSLISINDSKLIINIETPYYVYLVDLIKDDEFIEIAIHDDGPSGDPYTTFYRYDGESIKEISGGFYTDIDSENSISAFYGLVLTNGKGIFISPEDIVKFVSPNIIKGYTILKDNELVNNQIDYSKSLNKEYTINSDFEAYFINQKISDDLDIKDIRFTWYEYNAEFHKGQKIKIKVIDDYWFWYGVELEDGTTGVLYFWAGD